MPDLLQNIILIGMPGAGKSTVGAHLAQHLSRPYMDTDALIEARTNAPLQHIVDTQGRQALLAMEEEVLLNLHVTGHIIATGGSAVYSARAMQHLKSSGQLIYLEVSLATLEARINNFASRGIARASSQSLSDLWLERQALYQRYADHTIVCDTLSSDAVCAALICTYHTALA